MNTPGEKTNTRLLYPLNVWGLSFGCAVGWGAFMLPGNLFLPHAGPVGSIIAITLGGLAMLIIGANFCALAPKYRDNGGLFAYVREVMGYDHAFLTAWALLVTYLSIIWVNATAVVMLTRFLLGDVLQWGFHYQVAGFDVYAGEIFSTWAVLITFGLFSAYAGQAKRPINFLLALMLLGGIIVLFCGVLAMSSQHASFYPAFAPDIDGTPFWQIFSILMVAPWMFFGFESVTHGGEDFRFPIQHMFPLIAAAIVAAVLAYSLPIAISVMGRPPEYAGWNEYINSLDSLAGLKALPLFYSVSSLLGNNGLAILITAILAGIITGILGLYRGASFLLQAMAKDQLLPEIFATQAEDGTPRKAVMLIMGVSLFIPFLGRTAIVWLVDAITISGALAYAYVSLCRYQEAKASDDGFGEFMGILGFVLSAFFFCCPIIPDLLLGSTLNTESYLLLAVWSVIGLVYYWYVFKHDQQKRFGKSFSMCTVLLFLNFFSSALWLRQVMVTKIPLAHAGGYTIVHETLNTTSLIQITLIMLILLFMADIFTTMRRREHQLTIEVVQEQRTSRTRSAFLSNMTHDISLMMQAMMSYVKLARITGNEYKTIKGNCPQETLDSLWQGIKHTASISHYFLNLVQEMANVDRIKGTKLVLFTKPTDIRYSLQQVKNIFVTQMQYKNLDFLVYTGQIENPYVYCDNARLQRIILNLVSLAYDFTPTGGSVAVTLAQNGFAYQNKKNGITQGHHRLCADYELRIHNSGAVMPEEFITQFHANQNWRELFKIAGPERGLAITKHLVELMNGTIHIDSSQENGTEITIHLTFNLAKQSTVPAIYTEQQEF